jgi:hypothetical protein
MNLDYRFIIIYIEAGSLRMAYKTKILTVE